MKGSPILFICGLVITQGCLAYLILESYRAYKRGFSNEPSPGHMLEVIFIMGIFCLIGGYISPNLIKYAARSKQSEAKTNLGAIYVAQLSYFSAANTYADHGYFQGKYLNCFQLINWEPAGQTRYAYFCGDASIPAKLPGVPEEVVNRSQWPLQIFPASTKNSFTAVAIGNIDNDSFWDAWMINDQKQLVNLMNDNLDATPLIEQKIVFRAKVWLKKHPILFTFYISGLFWIVFLVSLFYDARRKRKNR